MTVRCLSRPDRVEWPKTDVVSQDPSPVPRAARAILGHFIRATSMKPLHMSEGEHQQNIENYLDTMTWAERIAIEIELQTRNAPVHSFDYDPLR